MLVYAYLIGLFFGPLNAASHSSSMLGARAKGISTGIASHIPNDTTTSSRSYLPHIGLFARLKSDVLDHKRSWRNFRHYGERFQRHISQHAAENRHRELS